MGWVGVAIVCRSAGSAVTSQFVSLGGVPPATRGIFLWVERRDVPATVDEAEYAVSVNMDMGMFLLRLALM